MIFKEKLRKKIKGKLKYTNREIFTLEDGGIIAIDFMGPIFEPEANLETNNLPLLFVVPGLFSSS